MQLVSLIQLLSSDSCHLIQMLSSDTNAVNDSNASCDVSSCEKLEDDELEGEFEDGASEPVSI